MPDFNSWHDFLGTPTTISRNKKAFACWQQTNQPRFAYSWRAHRPHHNAPPASTTHCRPPTLAQALVIQSIAAAHRSDQRLVPFGAFERDGGGVDGPDFDGDVITRHQRAGHAARRHEFIGHPRRLLD